MNKKELGEYLEKKPGYVKKGSKTLVELLKEKGISLVGLTSADVKKVLREQNRAIKAKKKRKAKILVYDVETTQVTAHLWGSGKQYVGHNRIVDETQILTVAWKWLGEDKIDSLKWSKGSDKQLMKDFLEVYNSADMVMGWNNDRFDNRLINSRAMKYKLEVNTFVKSFDIMKKVKKEFNLASYSMAYVARYLGLQGKLNHSGIQMWDTIQWGSKKDAKREMKNMIAYNIQDVQLTEDIYIELVPYLKHSMHAGVFKGKGKCTCPSCASKKTKLYQTQYTPAGTTQRVMKCKKCKTKFKVSNTEYLKTK